MSTKNRNINTTSPTSTMTTTNHSTDTTSPTSTITDTTTSPASTDTTTNHSTDTTTSPATTLTSTTSPITTKKPLHISIGVNYRGFIKYANVTDIDISNTLSSTTTKFSKYIINVGKLAITSTSSTSTLIDVSTLTPTTTASTTTTKAVVKPTSIPPIRIYAEDNEYHDGDVYLTYEASGAINERDIVTSLPRTLTPTYDNSKFEFSSEYDWYYMKNGEKVEVNANDKHEIPLSVLSSTIIYIKVTPTTTNISNESQKTTQPTSSTSTLLTDSTTSYPIT